MQKFILDINRLSSFFLLIGIGVLLSSCMVGPDFKIPKAQIEKEWVERKAVTGKPYGTPEIFWWKSFDDPILTQLIELAYERNLTLQMVGVRIIQERAILSHGIGELFPQHQGVTGGYSFTYIPALNYNSSSSSYSAPGILAGLLPGPVSNNTSSSPTISTPSISINPYNVFNSYLFYSSWELDFWGKYRRQVESDKDNYLATVAAYDDALVSMIGEVASNYVNLRMYEEQIKITRQNVEIQKESLRIATVRFQGGQTSQLDVTQAQTELSQTEAQIPKLENNARVTKNALALLLGITPRDIDPLIKPGKIPAVPDSMTAGIPKDLLRRRPDVRRTALTAASKSALIGVNVAVMFPSFSLTGVFGGSSSNLGTQQLMNVFNWQNALMAISPGFSQPIANYGQLINNVRTSVAAAQQAILNYQNTVLSAQKEVEDGLSGYYQGKKSVHYLNEAVKAAKNSTKLAMVRYKEGQTDYTTVLTAEQQQLSVENSYAAAQGNTLLAVVATYRSLGGGWQLRYGHDVISEDVKKQMRDRTNWAWWGSVLKAKNHLPAIAPEDRPTHSVPKNRPIWDLVNVNK